MPVVIHSDIEILILEWNSPRRTLQLTRTFDASSESRRIPRRKSGSLALRDNALPVSLSPLLRVGSHSTEYLTLPTAVAIVANRLAAEFTGKMIEFVNRLDRIVL